MCGVTCPASVSMPSRRPAAANVYWQGSVRRAARDRVARRCRGVFAAHAALRAAVTPGGRGAGARKRAVAPEPPTPQDVRMNWARRLKRVFGIEIEHARAAAGTGRGGGADDLARGASAVAGIVVLIRLIVDGLVLLGASGGQCCARRGRRKPAAASTS